MRVEPLGRTRDGRASCLVSRPLFPPSKRRNSVSTSARVGGAFTPPGRPVEFSEWYKRSVATWRSDTDEQPLSPPLSPHCDATLSTKREKRGEAARREGRATRPRRDAERAGTCRPLAATARRAADSAAPATDAAAEAAGGAGAGGGGGGGGAAAGAC